MSHFLKESVKETSPSNLTEEMKTPAKLRIVPFFCIIFSSIEGIPFTEKRHKYLVTITQRNLNLKFRKTGRKGTVINAGIKSIYFPRAFVPEIFDRCITMFLIVVCIKFS